MTDNSRGYVVECFWAGVTEAELRAADARARASARELERQGAEIRYLGSVLIAVDEVVLFHFEGPSAGLVGRASTAAGLPFERVMESIHLPQYEWLASSLEKER